MKWCIDALLADDYVPVRSEHVFRTRQVNEAVMSDHYVKFVLVEIGHCVLIDVSVTFVAPHDCGAIDLLMGDRNPPYLLSMILSAA